MLGRNLGAVSVSDVGSVLANRIVPNFFVVGAPKCGTTALCEYLRDHPNVFMSYPKEPHYFADDFTHFHVARTLDEYMKLFGSCTADHLAVGEGSVWYLYSDNAIRNIHRFNSTARIIVMVRNPVDVVHSLHSHNIFSFAEDRHEIAEAWRLLAERKCGRSIPKKCIAPRFLQYREIAEFGAQLEKLYAAFPAEQIKCLVFDDLRDDPAQVYSDVVEFLGVAPDGRKEFPVVNENKVHRSKVLGSFLLRPPRPLRFAWRQFRKVRGVEVTKAIDKAMRLNSIEVSRAPMDPEFRRNLALEFEEDVRKLSGLLDRDLTYWTQT